MIKPKLLVVAHTNLGTSLSGGDRIFLNLIKYWQDDFKITLLASFEAQSLSSQFHLKVNTIPTSAKTNPVTLNTFNLFSHHTLRFISGLYFCLTNKDVLMQSQYIYTASDFYGDFVFGLIAKIFNPKIKWLCGYYLIAPNPFNPDSNYIKNNQFFRGVIYYLAQRITIILAKSYADSIFVTSLPDVNVFLNNRLTVDKVPIIQGGVYIPSSQKLKILIPAFKRKFDAIYIGRLHSQKGVVEMIDIWAKVVKEIPSAYLNVVGDGELMETMLQKIKKLKLTNNIKLIGFLIGKQKFDLIKQSKVVLHPASQDSGGMAAAEAMAWGLPGVSFDLPALTTYYPTGMIKTKCYDYNQFAQNIIKLLTDKEYYSQYSSAARTLTIKSWNWQKRFATIKQNLI